MRQVVIYSLLVIMLGLTGCPIATDNPIDEGSYDVPSWLPGKWSTRSGPTLSPERYRLEKGKKKGQLKCYSLDTAGNVTGTMDPIILSKVGDKIFLSAYNTDHTYYLFEFKKHTETSFELIEVDEDAFTAMTDITLAASSAELKKFFEKNKNVESLFGDNAAYIKE